MSASWTKMDKMKSRYGGLIFQPDENLVGDDIGFSYDEMSAQMQEIISYTRGDTCTGTILGFEPNGALVDIGVKSSAYCALGEMALVKPSKCEDVFAIGDSVEFVITSREDENGQLMLSRRRILYQEAWDHVAQLYADEKRDGYELRRLDFEQRPLTALPDREIIEHLKANQAA